MWIETYTGRKFYPLDPREEDIELVDIAHALGMICRYTGHSHRFYSVAEHCYWVSQICESKLWGLMHDASEAYISDIARPIKPFLINYKSIEKSIMEKVAIKFNLGACPPDVKIADNIMLATEANQMFRLIPEWSLTEMPIDLELQFWTPEQAKQMFLNKYKEVT